MTFRGASRLLSFVIVALVVLSACLAVAFKGPASRYPQGSTVALLRTWLVMPGSFGALLLPACAVVAVTTMQRPRGSWIRLAVIAAVTIPSAIAMALFIGCNHAGACL